MQTHKQLKINPILKPKHIRFYFQVGKNTATTIIRTMKDSLGREIVTYQDFYNQFDAFPDPKFNPIWITKN